MSRKTRAKGNGRRGRPKGSPNYATIVRKIAAERVPMRDAGGQREVTIYEAVILKLQQLAMKGDIAADKRLDQSRAKQAPVEESNKAAVLIVPGMLPMDDWIRRAAIANQFTEPPKDLPTPNSSAQAPLTNAVNQPVKQPGRKHSPRKVSPLPQVPPRLIR